jgi:hypothetical protein
MYWDDDFAMQEYSQLSWDIWTELADTTNLWYQTYKEHWGLENYDQPEYLTDDEWKEARRNDEVAARLYRVALALNLFEIADEPPKTPMKEENLKALRDLLRTIGKTTQIRDRFSLTLAADAMDQLTGSSDRCLRLLGILRAQSMSRRASLFIGRATRLFVWGFEPEATIMCRAALEAALAERLAGSYDEDGRPPNLDGLIQLAGEKGVLEGFEWTNQAEKKWRARTDSPLWRAQRIKWSGNYAAHDQPGFGGERIHVSDAFNAIREFSQILGYLFPGPSEGEPETSEA